MFFSLTEVNAINSTAKHLFMTPTGSAQIRILTNRTGSGSNTAITNFNVKGNGAGGKKCVMIVFLYAILHM